MIQTGGQTFTIFCFQTTPIYFHNPKPNCIPKIPVLRAVRIVCYLMKAFCMHILALLEALLNTEPRTLSLFCPPTHVSHKKRVIKGTITRGGNRVQQTRTALTISNNYVRKMRLKAKTTSEYASRSLFDIIAFSM